MTYGVYPIYHFPLFPVILGKSISKIIPESKSPLLEILHSIVFPKIKILLKDCLIDSCEKLVCLL